MENNSNAKTNRLVMIEWGSLAALLIACFLFLLSETKDISCRIEQRMLSNEQRTDRLYEMFIDLLKEGRK